MHDSREISTAPPTPSLLLLTCSLVLSELSGEARSRGLSLQLPLLLPFLRLQVPPGGIPVPSLRLSTSPGVSPHPPFLLILPALLCQFLHASSYFSSSDLQDQFFLPYLFVGTENDESCFGIVRVKLIFQYLCQSIA